MTKAISILGCTGSIGRQSIAAAEHLGLPVAAMTVNKKADSFAVCTLNLGVGGLVLLVMGNVTFFLLDRVLSLKKFRKRVF